MNYKVVVHEVDGRHFDLRPVNRKTKQNHHCVASRQRQRRRHRAGTAGRLNDEIE